MTVAVLAMAMLTYTYYGHTSCLLEASDEIYYYYYYYYYYYHYHCHYYYYYYYCVPA